MERRKHAVYEDEGKVLTSSEMSALIPLGDDFYLGNIDHYVGIYEIDSQTHRIVTIQMGLTDTLPVSHFIALLGSKLTMDQLQLFMTMMGNTPKPEERAS